MKADLNTNIEVPTLLTPDETARLLRVSKTSIYRLIDRRSLPFYRVNRSLRFDKKDILIYLSGNRVESARGANLYERA